LQQCWLNINYTGGSIEKEREKKEIYGLESMRRLRHK